MMWPFKSLQPETVVRILTAAGQIVPGPDLKRLTDMQFIKGSPLESDSLPREWHPSRLDLLGQLQRLSRDSLVELAALYWFGRGDANYREVLRYADQSLDAEVMYYLVEKTDLKSALIKGLQGLKVSQRVGLAVD